MAVNGTILHLFRTRVVELSYFIKEKAVLNQNKAKCIKAEGKNEASTSKGA